MFYLGIVLVLAIIVSISILSGKKKKGQSATTKTANAGIVSGALIGTLVGGSSTIGTAQLAFTYGFSAWWFTLGGGIGVLLLLIFYFPFKKKNVTTLADAITTEYGTKAGITLALLNSLGTFLSFIAQIISGSALIMAVTSLNFVFSVLLVSLLMIVYVVFGGQKALGNAGLAKTIVLAASIFTCGVFALIVSGGISAFTESTILEPQVYFNLFARGITVDLGAGISLLIGVVTTQSYISAVLSSKSDKDAVMGSILTAVIVPLIGIAGIIVGLYMRVNCPDIDSKLALPSFIFNNMPPFIAGVMIAALLIAVIGTGAGLSFGMSTMLYKNVYKTIINKKANPEKEKRVSQIILLFIVVFGTVLCLANLSGIILEWSFMSMGLRGAVAVVPLVFALFFPKKISKVFIIVSMIAGALFTLIGKFILPSSIDPMFLGLGISFIVAIIGMIVNHIKQKEKEVKL